MIPSIDSVTASQCAALVWKTRDGRILKWSEMSTAHLRNAAKHLRERKHERALELLHTVGHVRGEHAMDHANEEIDHVTDEMVLIDRYAGLMISYANWRTAGHA